MAEAANSSQEKPCVPQAGLSGELSCIRQGGVMMIQLGCDGRWIDISKAFYGLLGYTREEVFSRSPEKLIHADDFPPFWGQCQQLIRQETESFDAVLRFLSNVGGHIWMYQTCTVVNDAEGKPHYLVMYMHDMTDCKRIEEELRKTHDELETRVRERTAELERSNLQLQAEILERQSIERMLKEKEGLYKTLLETIPYGVQEVDVKGNIVFSNVMHDQIYGYEHAEMIGKSIFDLTPSAAERKRLEDYWAMIFKRKPLPVPYIARQIRKDGRIIDIQADWSYKKNKDGEVVGFIAVLTDITERLKADNAQKEAELELSQQKTALEQKNVALQEVLAQIEIEKKHIKDDVILNIDRLLMPVLKRLKRKGTRLDRTHIGLLEENLGQLTSSLGRKLSDKKRKLTPREIEICNMIRNGLSSKEIAGLLHISYRTIELHRATIRRKFGITHKMVNLASYIQSL